MKSKKILLIVATVASSVSLVASCVPSGMQKKNKAASLSSGADQASGMSKDCDLATTAAKTNEGVREQLECVRKIADLVGPGWVKVIIGAADIAQLLSDAQNKQIDVSDPAEPKPTTEPVATAQTDSGNGATGSFLTTDTAVLDKSSMTAWELITELGDKTSEKLPKLFGPCLKSIQESNGSFKDAVNAAVVLSKEKSLSYNNIENMIEGIRKGVQGSLELARALDICTASNPKQSSTVELKAFIDRFKSGFDKLSSALGTIKVIANCGVNIAHGAIVLKENTQCLVEDLKNLKSSNARLENTLSGPGGLLPKDGPAVPYNRTTDRCNAQPADDAIWAMRVWGEYLRNQYAGTLTRRSTFCASKCSNTGTGVDQCKGAAERMFGEFAKVCGNAVCGTAQSQTAVSECVSNCCGLESDCNKAANEKVQY